MDRSGTSGSPDPPAGRDPMLTEGPTGSESLGDDLADIEDPRPARRFNPEPTREMARTALAAGSFLLLCAVVLVILLIVASGTRTWDEMQGVASAVLPAVLSVTGTSLGFYFGAKDR